jgi:hypothetical protein
MQFGPSTAAGTGAASSMPAFCAIAAGRHDDGARVPSGQARRSEPRSVRGGVHRPRGRARSAGRPRER